MIRNSIICLCLSITLVGCHNKKVTSYNKVTQLLKDYNIDTSKYITLFFYRPLECVNCNALLSAIIKDNKINILSGKNVFIVYRGIRENEATDYQKDLNEIGNINLNLINNEGIYDNIVDLIQDKSVDNSRPFILICSFDKLYRYDMHDENIISEINSIP